MTLFSNISFDELIRINHPVAALIRSGVLSSDPADKPYAVEFNGYTSAFPHTAHLFGQLKPHTIEAPEVSPVVTDPVPTETPEPVVTDEPKVETPAAPADEAPDPVDEVPTDPTETPAEDVAEVPADAPDPVETPDPTETPAEASTESPDPE